MDFRAKYNIKIFVGKIHMGTKYNINTFGGKMHFRTKYEGCANMLDICCDQSRVRSDHPAEPAQFYARSLTLFYSLHYLFLYIKQSNRAEQQVTTTRNIRNSTGARALWNTCVNISIFNNTDSF